MSAIILNKVALWIITSLMARGESISPMHGSIGRSMAIGAGGSRVISRLNEGRFVVWWIWTLYAHVRGNMNVSQSILYAAAQFLNLDIRVALKGSTCP